MRLTLLLILLLSGCATPEQRAERAIAKFAPYCEKLGYQQDTDGWRSCIQASDTSARAAGAAYGAAISNAAIQSRPKTCLPTNGGYTCF